eukprot:jgi/Botrbrau1/17615/Bobra.0166s0051.1
MARTMLRIVMGCILMSLRAMCACTVKGPLNGVISEATLKLNVASVADCQQVCESTSGCSLFQFCNSSRYCMNNYQAVQFFSRPEPSPQNSCRIGTGFEHQAPDDITISGFTVGYCGALAEQPAVSAANQNVGGTVVVLDINSQKWYPGGGLRYDTKDLCAAACKQVEGCNTWVFCDAPEGQNCGAGCPAFGHVAESHSPLDGYGPQP